MKTVKKLSFLASKSRLKTGILFVLFWQLRLLIRMMSHYDILYTHKSKLFFITKQMFRAKNETNKQPLLYLSEREGKDFIQLYDIDKEKKKIDDSQSVDLVLPFHLLDKEAKYVPCLEVFQEGVKKILY